jgi:hypothetical protein
MTQDLITALLVAFAAIYSIWYVLPANARQRLGRLHHALARAPHCASGCGSCGKCSVTGAGEQSHEQLNQKHPAPEQSITFYRKR